MGFFDFLGFGKGKDTEDARRKELRSRIQQAHKSVKNIFRLLRDIPHTFDTDKFPTNRRDIEKVIGKYNRIEREKQVFEIHINRILDIIKELVPMLDKRKLVAGLTQKLVDTMTEQEKWLNDFKHFLQSENLEFFHLESSPRINRCWELQRTVGKKWDGIFAELEATYGITSLYLSRLENDYSNPHPPIMRPY